MEEIELTNNQQLSSIESELRAEKVIDKRLQNNRIEYLINWIGKDEETWVDAESLNRNNELLQAFENAQRCRQVQARSQLQAVVHEDSISQEFSKELEAEQIIGCTDNRGYLQFLVKWKGVDKADLMSAREVKDKYPQIVQNFYQERLSWKSH